MFSLENVTFEILNKQLLEPISLTFERGKVYGLIGHNGSGKSTLIKLLAKQIPYSSGKITFNHKELNKWSSREFAKHVAYLPQYLPQTTNLTARELITMGRYAWNGLFGQNKKEDNEAIQRALELTHTERFVDQFVDVLSGGERSRIWLAMLLAQQSQFLLLDEPLAALDIAYQVEVMQLIQKLAYELNLGIIIVIHDINLASRYCDHLIALYSGRLLVQGSANEIVNRETLKDIYNIDLNVIRHPQSNNPVSFY